MSPNILTLTEGPVGVKQLGTTTSQYFIHSAPKRPIHCSALIAVGARKLLRAWDHFPHGPKRFVWHFARRRGIPRTSLCKNEYSCPSIGTVYEVSICPTRCRYWVTVMCLLACKSSISRLFKSARKRGKKDVHTIARASSFKCCVAACQLHALTQ